MCVNMTTSAVSLWSIERVLRKILLCLSRNHVISLQLQLTAGYGRRCAAAEPGHSWVSLRKSSASREEHVHDSTRAWTDMTASLILAAKDIHILF